MYSRIARRRLGVALFTLGAVGVGSAAAAVVAQPFDQPERDQHASATTVATQAAVSQVTADDAHASVTGDGVKVAVLDSGFDTGHVLWTDVVYSGEYDAVDDDYDVDESPNGTDDDTDGVTDRNVGHGNFVVSLIHAAAPDAIIVPIRILDDEGNGTNADLVTGIEHAISEGVDVINLSGVITSADQDVKDALKDATEAGITFVTAAGNAASGAFNDGYVRNRTITVGAVDSYDAVTSWSPNGPGVDLYAPGLDCVGALDDAAIDYGWWDGTSFAAPWVSAAAALALEDDALRTAEDVRDLLTDTAASVTGSTPSNRGRVDCDAAVNE